MYVFRIHLSGRGPVLNFTSKGIRHGFVRVLPMGEVGVLMDSCSSAGKGEVYVFDVLGDGSSGGLIIF